MATTTENLGLTLPAGTDRALVSDLNKNFQTLDAFAGQATADIQEAQETANAAAPQATTYTKSEVDIALAAKLDTSDVDDALSSTSTNPVQNKAVQAPVARLVDAGAKNLLNLGTPDAINRTTIADVGNGSVTASCANVTWANSGYYIEPIAGKAYKFIIYVDSASVSDVQFQCFVRDVSGSIAQELGRTQRITSPGVYSVDFVATTKISVGINLNNSGTVASGSATYHAMICTLADYKISPEFVPYAPSNRELYEEVRAKASINEVYGLGSIIANGSDLNDFRIPGVYAIQRDADAATISNVPISTAARIEVFAMYNSSTYMQRYTTFASGAPVAYERRFNGSSWGSWYKFEGTEVT